MKKIITVSVFVLFFALAPLALAQSTFVPLAPIPGLTQGATADTAGLANFFNNLYKYLIGLAAALAVIMITWSGIEIAMNRDNASKITDSKGKIYNAIFGLVLVLSPALVFSIINPSILNLSLNLPKLDTKPWDSSSQSAINVKGTGTVCSGYSEYRAANIPVQKYCIDQFGGGWVNVDTSCCSGQSNGSACCGLSSSYTAPVETAPISIPGGEVVYSDVSKIPSGSWCYKISTGVVIKSTQFDCGPDQPSCIDLYSTDKNTSSRAIIGSCTKY